MKRETCAFIYGQPAEDLHTSKSALIFSDGITIHFDFTIERGADIDKAADDVTARCMLMATLWNDHQKSLAQIESSADTLLAVENRLLKKSNETLSVEIRELIRSITKLEIKNEQLEKAMTSLSIMTQNGEL